MGMFLVYSITITGKGSSVMSRMLNMFRKSRKGFYGRGTSSCVWLILIACLSLACLAGKVNAAISTTGDVAPSDPATWDEDTDAYIGKTSDGSMSITSGSDIESHSVFIGNDSGVDGAVTITGSGSTWTNSSSILVAGDYGDGTLDITAGGAVSNTEGYIGRRVGSTGEVTVDGTGSTWTNSLSLNVGNIGNGTLNITAGGAVNNTTAYIGALSGSTGEVTVSGTGSTWTNSLSLNVGNIGNGTLNITAGGAVNNTTAYIGALSGSTGEVTVSGTGSTWTNSGNLIVGLSGNGTLDITAGGVVSNTSNGFIGYNEGVTGVVTVDGTGSTWTNSVSLQVGHIGNGTLNITAGGAVSNAVGYIGYNEGSTGVVTVDGDDGSGNASTWTNTGHLYVGYSGGKAVINEEIEVTRGGVLNITDGGEVTNVNGYIGYSSVTFASPDYHLSAGKATIDGTDSTWTNSGNLYVGYGAAGLGTYAYGGEMVVSNGGLVENVHGYIGTLSGSTAVVTVTGTNSEWNNSGNLYVGGAGTGTLTVSSGGAVTSSAGYIGNSSGSTGAVVVTSSSTWTNTGDLRVGNTGQGSLTIEAGCSVSSSNLYIGYTSSSNNTVSVSGANAALTVSSGLYVGGGSSTAGNGMMSITGNGAVSNANGHIGSYTGSTGTVVVNGSGTTWTNTGDLVVGDDGTGMLYIHSGGLVIVDGTLTIDDDNDNDSFVNMKTGAQLSLYGEGDDSLNDFLTLIDGDDNNVIRYWDGSAWDDLANATKVDPIDLDLYNEYSLVYDAGYTTLTVGVISDPLVPLMGDANRDGVVSAGDYASVQANFGHTSYPGDWDLYGDANWDGVVSAGDYASVQINFGNVASSDVPVPEPATMCLLGLGSMMMLLRKRK